MQFSRFCELAVHTFDVTHLFSTPAAFLCDSITVIDNNDNIPGP